MLPTRSPNERPIIVLAAHDDGTGAFTTMTRIAKAIWSATEKSEGLRPVVVLLHSRAASRPYLREFWDEAFPKSRAEVATDLRKWDPKYDARDCGGVWATIDNLIRLETQDDGRLNGAKTADSLYNMLFERVEATNETQFSFWPNDLIGIPKNRVKLTIEMGVPQLSDWASTLPCQPPAISVGDADSGVTVLQKTLEMNGEYDSRAAKVILALEACEQRATEAWVLPIASPREYCEYYSRWSRPLSWLPGLLIEAPEPNSDDRNELKENAIQEIRTAWSDNTAAMDSIINKEKKVVMMTAGSRGVWAKINNKAATDLIKRKRSSCALLFTQRQDDLLASLQKKLKSNTGEKEPSLFMVADGEIRAVKNLPSLLPYQMFADFGITRGGISSLEFVIAQTPLLVVQEENHWLSLKQQANLREQNLAYTCSLLRFREDPMRVIDNYLSPNVKWSNEMMKERMAYVKFGVTDEWVRYILRYYTNLVP